MEHIENDSKYAGLSVNKGISQPPSVNPNLAKKAKRKLYTAAEYVDGITKGNISLLGQAVTLIESSNPDHYKLAQEVIEKCLPLSGNSTRIGITGVPGAGKSTFIEALGLLLVNKGYKLAVLAIDPSSERSKGSILGDKTRMEELSASNKAFIRPSPSAGSLGGVARKTRETIVLCEAAGFNKVFVETVGVGQSETAVHSMVDFFLLLQITGAGDELQGIKRGIMEMADGIIINKAEGNNIERAKLAQAQFINALHLFPAHESGWKPQVLTCSASHKTGIVEIWNMIEEYTKFTEGNGYFAHKRHYQTKYWMYETIDEKLKSNFYSNPIIADKLGQLEQQVMNDEVSSFIAAHKLLDEYFRM
ncbi:MAG: methylmalonyl Co-A mutase-associated GTPase MeaB [Bacteroidia bacterium]|nr:methylmalonyl Co-A mutase-associated GTPase MeaB [Bacteroidia bacterium]